MDGTISQARIDSTFKYLLLSRVARSIGLNYVTLSLSLYLLALGITITIVGILFFLNVFLSTVISLVVGSIGDRTKYKYALIIAEAPSVVGTFCIFASSNITVIVVAMVISGVAGAPGAARGVFSPGSTAMIATNWPTTHSRVQRLGRLTSIGAFSSVGGSILLFYHGILAGTTGTILAFRYLYLVSFLLMLTSIIGLAFVAERPHKRQAVKFIGKRSLKFTARVMFANSFNGAGIGLAVALLPAWFQIAYGVNSSQIGLVFIASYLATAAGSYYASISNARMSEHSLMIGSITRSIQGLMIVLIAFMPSLFFAGIAYFTRSLIAGVGMPFRTTLNISGISSGEMGFGSSLQGSSMRFSQMTSGLAGYLTEVSIPLPVFIGGLLQFCGGFAYYKMLGPNGKKKNT